jgi:chromosome partitioning protein
MRSIACLSFKGGTGKSTTALALSVGIVQRLPDARLLLVDNDPQSNATLIMLDGKPADEPTLADVLLDQADVTEAIRKTRIDRLDLLPADRRLADCTSVLAEVELGKERRLSRALKSIENEYDFCIVDSPGQWSLLAVNILQAVDDVICPIELGAFGIAGLERLQETVDRVRDFLQHPKLAIISCLITRVTKNRVATALEQRLRTAHKGLISQAVIPASFAVEEAHDAYRTIMEWAPRSAVAKAYGELVTEVLGHERKSRNARRKAKPKGAA